MGASGKVNTIIIGAGAAGLSSAACLKRKGISFLIFDKAGKIGNQWVERYDRLHLHTPKRLSGLPYYKMPAAYPKYVSKNDFADYLNAYASASNIQPLFNHQVEELKKQGDEWNVITKTGSYRSSNIIIATGYAHKPRQVLKKELEGFAGEIIHSSAYKNGAPYKNKKVLVVGCGNSAAEIAICLHEHQAFPSLSIRGANNVIPRDIAGFSVIDICVAQQWITRISPRLTDAVNSPLLRLVNGNLEKYGFAQPRYGPITQVLQYKKIPLVDVGTIKLVKEGKIKVFPGINTVEEKTVEFTDGSKIAFEVIICATGFEPGYSAFLNVNTTTENNLHERLKQEEISGLYFCGFQITPTGMLREIGIEAQRIAEAIGRQGS
jgi:NADPH-dependent glutamate synthase beta subunit-like oxidoreductase